MEYMKQITILILLLPLIFTNCNNEQPPSDNTIEIEDVLPKITFSPVEDSLWNSQPIYLENIDIQGIDSLLKSNNGSKWRLINFWATWCPPCVIEYPELIKIHRYYDEVELISINADWLHERDKVLAFLEKNHSAIPNYMYGRKNTDLLTQLLDDNWDGGLPYSLLIDSTGTVIKRHQGIIDPVEWRLLLQ